jgi:hypothetical protein
MTQPCAPAAKKNGDNCNSQVGGYEHSLDVSHAADKTPPSVPFHQIEALPCSGHPGLKMGQSFVGRQ